jgi:hypothetical protein
MILFYFAWMVFCLSIAFTISDGWFGSQYSALQHNLVYMIIRIAIYSAVFLIIVPYLGNYSCLPNILRILFVYIASLLDGAIAIVFEKVCKQKINVNLYLLDMPFLNLVLFIFTLIIIAETSSMLNQ